ncbi:MAG TPA: molybdopterin-binding oxidoreductase, partial [Rugosimonospora sp.]|nr:molybdopterin-binding oxidoreductase [Rugosimonospora sp.]
MGDKHARWVGPVAGVVATGVALGVAELVAALVAPRAAPLVAVGGWVIDHVPEPVKEFATSTFGTHDKTALLIGTSVLLAAYGGLVGWLATRRPWQGMAGIAVVGVVGILSALTRAGAKVSYLLPSFVGAVAAAFALDYLLNRTRPRGVPAGRAADGATRRRFLIGSGMLAGVA